MSSTVNPHADAAGAGPWARRGHGLHAQPPGSGLSLLPPGRGRVVPRRGRGRVVPRRAEHYRHRAVRGARAHLGQ